MEQLNKIQRIGIKNKKPLRIEMHTLTEPVPLHWHNYIEVELILSGRGKCTINQTEFPIGTGSLYFLKPTDFHIVSVEEEMELINIGFDENMLSEKMLSALLFAENNQVFPLCPEAMERFVMAVKLLQHECDTDGDCQKLLLEYLLNCLFRSCGLEANGSAGKSDCSGITRAILYLQMHFREHISLETLAREAGYNPTYFSELFSRVTGERYLEMLTRLRIGYACACLANGLSVSDTCFLSGFNSLSNFLSTFKRHCHMTPRDYRKKYGHT